MSRKATRKAKESTKKCKTLNLKSNRTEKKIQNKLKISKSALKKKSAADTKKYDKIIVEVKTFKKA